MPSYKRSSWEVYAQSPQSSFFFLFSGIISVFTFSHVMEGRVKGDSLVSLDSGGSSNLLPLFFSTNLCFLSSVDM